MTVVMETLAVESDITLWIVLITVNKRFRGASVCGMGAHRQCQTGSLDPPWLGKFFYFDHTNGKKLWF